MKLLIPTVVLAALLIQAASAAPAEGSCSYSYGESTLYVYDIKQHSLRVEIVDTDTEAVLHMSYAYVRDGNYIGLGEYAGDVDATTEFKVYSTSNKIGGGNDGKLLAECYV